MTWVEVADTAIKISLGALVAGAFGYLTARLSYEREDRARYATRRRDNIEKVLEKLTQVERTLAKQQARINKYRHYVDSDERLADEAEVEFAELDKRLYEEIHHFRRASSILLMLGEKKAERRLEAYAEAIDEWFQYSDPVEGEFSKDLYDELAAKLETVRGSAYDALAAAYKRV